MTRAALLGALATVSVLALFSVYTVDSAENVLVTEFGLPLRVVTEAGLHFKLPHQSVRRFDNRLFVYAVPASEFLTVDKAPAVASASLIWRIADPRLFFETVFDRSGAESRLGDIVYAQLGAAIGTHNLAAFVSVDPDAYRAPGIVAELRRVSGEIARRQYGIELVELALAGFDLPKQNRPRLYARMKSERARLSMKYRSEGEEESLKARAGSEEERGRLLAEASIVAQRSRTEGDVEAARLFREGVSAAPDLYRFLQTVDASRRLLRKDTTLVLPANSGLFGLLLDRDWLLHGGAPGIGRRESGAASAAAPPRLQPTEAPMR